MNDERPIAYTKTGKPLSYKYLRRILQYHDATKLLLNDGVVTEKGDIQINKVIQQARTEAINECIEALEKQRDKWLASKEGKTKDGIYTGSIINVNIMHLKFLLPKES